ncbi:ComF family protein [Bathymodiolus heckerae thiotrophic gill symbiont]|uniref:ComF family protein n=1 Tax=Bathymodiolus heckerae thiotrophic gill symbiont TaxID=1052212 RepID=UPI0010FDDC36|nr:ComF family protein [Bathymodiolus heckerae thiotrophic gill symbiont]CAC9598781.1 Competence protein F homolog, phosphoribosyltransferase domain; protein YhgH required for utilization of DNA as sole source of carbon and energy [uncultured Gammaproteobacteria bacterium]
MCEYCEQSLQVSQHRCRSCAVPLNSDLHFCGACLTHAPLFANAYALYDYSGVCANLIKRFKFDHQLCIGDFFAHKLHEKYLNLVSDQGEYDAIIPLPLSANRLRERGYNQTHELLRVIAKKSNILIDRTSVKRIKLTRALSTLNLEERKIEINNAFSAQAMIYNKVLLVDDVMTTGSSLNELAKTVLKAGAKSCDVLTVARA